MIYNLCSMAFDRTDHALAARNIKDDFGAIPREGALAALIKHAPLLAPIMCLLWRSPSTALFIPRSLHDLEEIQVAQAYFKENASPRLFSASSSTLSLMTCLQRWPPRLSRKASVATLLKSSQCLHISMTSCSAPIPTWCTSCGHFGLLSWHLIPSNLSRTYARPGFRTAGHVYQ